MWGVYLIKTVCRVVFKKLIAVKIRQLILSIGNDEGEVDGFVWGFSFAQRLHKKTFSEISVGRTSTCGQPKVVYFGCRGSGVRS